MEEKNRDLLVLTAQDVRLLLKNSEQQVIDVVIEAYKAFHSGRCSLPHSTFLHFEKKSQNRIIALPAFLDSSDSDENAVGLKWIASFPENIKKGIPRASAVIILNSPFTGEPEALLEASLISGWRTAASAAVAAQKIHADKEVSHLALLGCGYINFEVVRFLSVAFPQLSSLSVYDINLKYSLDFRDKVMSKLSINSVQIADSVEALFDSADLVSIATTASVPHLTNPGLFKKGSTVLHLSLRDLSPEIILACDNVVDDLDHVCRASTSIHLTEQIAGHRKFVRCSIPEILNGSVKSRYSSEDVVLFSPFGLGILDLAVAQFVYKKACHTKVGKNIYNFIEREVSS